MVLESSTGSQSPKSSALGERGGNITEQKKEFPTAMALVMARSAKRVALKYGDLGLARAARELQARALSAIKMRQSYFPDDTAASASLPAEQKSIPEKTVDRIRPPTASEAANMVDSAHERGLMEALEILKKGSSGHRSPASRRAAYPTASALVMARALRRVAVKYEDLGLARRAKDLQARALSAIRMRQSYLPDDTSTSAKHPVEPKPIPKKTVDRILPPTPSEMEAMVDRHQEQALKEAADRYKARNLTNKHD